MQGVFKVKQSLSKSLLNLVKKITLKASHKIQIFHNFIMHIFSENSFIFFHFFHNKCE